jgi:RNA polymerase-interacting CarD/CdnL/TRCF family regulator
MTKFGWDLPPGVTTSMLPGNTPEDQAEEAKLDAIYTAIELAGYAPDEKSERLAESFSKLMDTAYADGRRDAQADEDMAKEYHIMSMEEIVSLLAKQASMRSLENDESGSLQLTREFLLKEIAELDAMYPERNR